MTNRLEKTKSLTPAQTNVLHIQRVDVDAGFRRGF